MKKIIYQLHLWLGLVSGLLVFIIAVTGALYTFQDEISACSSYRQVEIRKSAYLQPSVLKGIAEKELPGKTLHSVKYNKSSEAAEAVFYGYNPDYYYIIYINPYTGEVLKVKDMDKDFFRFVMQGHYYLWLPPQIGHPLMASATLIFLIIIISGLIIWIPKNRKGFRARSRFQWKRTTKWTRKNLDLHVVGGLYVSAFAIVFSLTGLVWGFQWFADGTFQLLGGKKSLQYTDVNPGERNNVQADPNSIDKVWSIMQHQYPDAASIEVHPPHDSHTLIAANANAIAGQYGETDYVYFDQNTCKEVNTNTVWGKAKTMNFAEQLYRKNYDIHTGSILGLPGKIFAFLMSLAIAGLPVTGVLIWWRKRRK